METPILNRRNVLLGLSAAIGLKPLRTFAATSANELQSSAPKETNAAHRQFTRTTPPDWLMAFWKEIDDKTWGDGFNCFREDAQAHLGAGVWNGREEIRENLKKFIDTGFTAHHDVLEYWDGGVLKVFRGIVTMTPDDKSQPVAHPVMSHFFYMDPADHTKVIQWFGAVGPVHF